MEVILALTSVVASTQRSRRRARVLLTPASGHRDLDFESPELDGGCRVNLASSEGFKTMLVMPQNFLECDREQVFLMPPGPA